MAVRATIRRTDDAPLGSIDDVKRHLGDAFPGLRFTLIDEAPRSVAKASERVPLLRRLWLTLIGRRVCCAHWIGAYGGPGYALELYFEAGAPVGWVRVTVSRPTAELRDRLGRLCAATDWSVVYGR